MLIIVWLICLYCHIVGKNIDDILNMSSAERGNIASSMFLELKETLQYLNLVSNKNLYYVLRQIITNESLKQRGSILLKLKVRLCFSFPVKIRWS